MIECVMCLNFDIVLARIQNNNEEKVEILFFFFNWTVNASDSKAESI